MPPRVALVALALAACSAGNEVPEHVFDPCTPLLLVPADDASAGELDGVAAAAADWRAAAGVHFVAAADADADTPRVRIRFQSAALVYYGLYEDTVPDIVINRDLTDPAARAVAIAHELGHAFGLVHVTGRSSVMNAGNLTVVPNAADAVDLAAQWGACPQR